ncbi:unnamed protein product, partial [Polarella glacialis]
AREHGLDRPDTTTSVMADKKNELLAEKETSALKKLQSAAGLVDKSSTVERLDWMYEQTSSQKPDDE